MIECFNFLLLSDDTAFEDLIDTYLESKLTSIQYQAISHLAIVPCVLLAVAYGLLYKEMAYSMK